MVPAPPAPNRTPAASKESSNLCAYSSRAGVGVSGCCMRCEVRRFTDAPELPLKHLYSLPHPHPRLLQRLPRNPGLH